MKSTLYIFIILMAVWACGKNNKNVSSDHQACRCIEKAIEYAESAQSAADLDHFEEIFVGKNPECTDAFMEESDDIIDSICPSLKEEVMRASREAVERLNWQE